MLSRLMERDDVRVPQPGQAAGIANEPLDRLVTQAGTARTTFSATSRSYLGSWAR
jgi:hypothetical protein